MLLKLYYILSIFLILNIGIYANINTATGDGVVNAAGQTLKAAPPDDKSAEKSDNTAEGEADVEFSMEDTRFLNLSLKESIVIAIQHNYDIRIARISPEIKGKDVTAAKSEFDPVLTITGDVGDYETPSNSELQIGLGGQLADFRQDKNTLNAKMEKLVETGATFTLEYNLERHFLDPATFAFINPYSTSSIEAKVVQPLLKNAGIFYNRSDIYIARNDRKRSVLELKETAIDVVNSVQKAYWELVKAIEELRVRKKSLERAEDLLKKNKIQVDVGTLPPIELLVAEEGVASQLEGVVVAENNIKDREDDLKQVMNLSNNPLLSDVTIVPLDKVSFEIRDVSLDESINTAMQNRPELFERGIDTENARIRVKQRRNELLPRFDFEAGIRYDGLDANYGNANDSAFSQDFQSEFFGITVEVPIGNREARSNYAKSKLEEKQSVFNTRKVEQEIIVEVRKAVRQIKTNAERIRATRKAEELSVERLKAEEMKFKVGRSTSLEIIRAQEDLAVSEGRATNAIVDYQISLWNLDAVLGTILMNNNIIIDDTDLVVKGRAGSE